MTRTSLTRRIVSMIVCLILLSLGLGTNAAVASQPPGIDWASQASAANNSWTSIAYGNGTFVAVGVNGSPNQVMTSPDGITWTSRTSAANNFWSSVTYGNGLFVAVSYSGTGNRVMTSPDGINWTSRTSAADNSWRSVTYGNGMFVAVCDLGSSEKVMTSPDGITWTSRTSAANNSWRSVAYGGSMFVAVSSSGVGDRVMTSSDGITWTSRTSAADNEWTAVAYGDAMFAAVSQSGTGNRVMTSEGIPSTVTFNANGGSGSMAPQSSSFPTNLTANAFVRSGYVFTSWNTQADGSGTTYANQAEFPFGANATLHAQWAPAPPTPGGAQRASSNCVTAGGTIPFRGVKRLMKPNCHTNAGKRIGVRVAPPSIRGDVPSYRLSCRIGKSLRPVSRISYGPGFRYCVRGALVIRTFGAPPTVRVTWFAPKTDTLRAYRKSKLFRS